MIRAKMLTVLLLVSLIVVNAQEEKYGKEITLKEKISVSAILASPDKFDGKTVRIEGKILGVCQEKGCWIEFAGEKEGEKIKVKVNDGEIVFPKDAKGKTALVQGVVAPIKEKSCDAEKGENKEVKAEMAECAKHKEAAVNKEECKDGKNCKHKDGKCECKHQKVKEMSSKKEGSCCSKEKKTKVYQIQGLGAVIK